jgi:hypothetical protein
MENHRLPYRHMAVNSGLFRVALLVAAARFKGEDGHGYVKEEEEDGAGFHGLIFPFSTKAKNLSKVRANCFGVAVPGRLYNSGCNPLCIWGENSLSDVWRFMPKRIAPIVGN